MGSKRTSQHNRLGRYGVGLGLAWFVQIQNKGFERAKECRLNCPDGPVFEEALDFSMIRPW